MTIKETAGKVLLVLYALQIENPIKLEQTSVVLKSLNKPKLETKSWLKDILHQVSDNDGHLYNAFSYLLDKGLLSRGDTTVPMGAIVLTGIHITGAGIDIIEGVEQGPEQRSVIKSLFSLNINVRNTITVDSLLKGEVGSIVGIGAAVSGKVEM